MERGVKEPKCSLRPDKELRGTLRFILASQHIEATMLNLADLSAAFTALNVSS